MTNYNLSYLWNNEKVYFAYVHIQGDNDSKELFLKFVRGRGHKYSNFWDAERNMDKDIKDIDHISFHKDGNIHITYKGSKKDHFSEKKLPQSISNMPKNSYIPLFTISINNPNKFEQFLGSNSAPEIGEYIADMNWNIHNKPFSITCFAIRNNCDPFLTLESKFPGVFDISDSLCFPYGINDKIGVVFMFSRGLIIDRTQSYINPKYDREKIIFEDIPVLGFSIFPSDQHLRSILSENI